MTIAARNIVFDLDGTLVDSAPVFVEVLNAMLEARGSLRRVTTADVRPFASLGGPALVGGILAQECGDLSQEVGDFRERYRRLPTPIQSMYDGVAEGVRYLASRGLRLAICSNKPQPLCDKVIAELGLAPHFAVVVGSSADRRAKPAPDLMELVLDRLGATASECLYVGDSEVDQALAVATDMRFAFVTYGYATGRPVVGRVDEFGRFPDLVRWIMAERPASLPVRVAA